MKLTTLAPGDQVQIKKNIAKRRGMFLTEPALLAYLLHPKFRGEGLLATERRRACDYIPQACQIAGIEKRPNVAEVLSFVDKQPPYAGDSECSLYQYWSVYMADLAVGPLGQVMSALIASQASVERVFSSAGWQSQDRESLVCESLKEEVYIRVNALQLGYAP